MKILNGYMGKILRVHLTTGEVRIEPLSQALIMSYIGGRGIAARLLYDELEPGLDPLSPANKMIFSSGPLTATAAPSCSRWLITTKSPLTGGIFRSCAGGGLGHEIKSAGFDVLIIEGKAARPAYLWINNDHVEIRRAEKLSGLLCSETTKAIHQELKNKKIKTATIGPAAEKMVRFASIADEGMRIAARGGVGMVMASKDLKAIAVLGDKKPAIANPEKLQNITKTIIHTFKGNARYQAFAHMGTATGVAVCHSLGIYPVNNFQDGVLEETENRLTVDETEKIFVKDYPCHHCYINCGRTLKVTQGPYAGQAVKGPEYEALFSFGGNLGNTDLAMIIEANRICDEYGLDAISAGGTISFAMELYEKGILTREELDGLDLTWGNHEAIMALLLKIVKREGIGDVLAEGSKGAAQKIGRGSDRYALHVKGLELPGYEPRALKASGLNLATTPLGASHVLGQSPQEMMPKGTPGAVDRFSAEGKGQIVKDNQDMIAVFETAISCIFPKALGLVTLGTLGQMLFAATGVEEFSKEGYLLEVGERIWNLERAFNAREGFTRKDDYLPERFIHESPKRGPAQGQVHEIDQMLDDYYEARAWDKKTAFPTPSKLKSLGLKAVAGELDERAKNPNHGD